VGVNRAREELQALSGRPTGEVTGASADIPETDVLVGTEAVLRRLTPADGADAVAFIDFDQELLAARVRAGEEALGLLALASRLVGGRRGRVLVQTRLPDHACIRAAVLADPAIPVADEQALRRSLRLPPAAAIAVISGAAGAGYVEALRAVPLEVIGPDHDRWLARAPDTDSLADGLATVPRPAGRLRVAVDPARF
jgi:primosomal protein N' (replication factor Y)